MHGAHTTVPGVQIPLSPPQRGGLPERPNGPDLGSGEGALLRGPSSGGSNPSSSAKTKERASRASVKGFSVLFAWSFCGSLW